MAEIKQLSFVEAVTVALPSETILGDSSRDLSNCVLVPTVTSSALTVNVKGKDGNAPSATNIIYIAFRNVTLTSGTYVVRSISAALSTVISSGSTGGHSSANAHKLYFYFIDNAGTVELAWSSKIFDEGSVVSTTAEGGAGAADSSDVMYSTTARSNVACRLVCRMDSTQSTAGTWAAVPTEVSMVPFQVYPQNSNSVAKTAAYTLLESDDFVSASTTGGAFSLTLPTAVGKKGKIFHLKKTSNDFTVLTVATTSSQTIDGVTTTTLNTQYEAISVISDNVNWHILRRHIPVTEFTYTPTFTGIGTPTNIQITGCRIGGQLLIRGKFTCGTTTATTWSMSLPTNLNIDTTNLTSSFNSLGEIEVMSSSTTFNQVDIHLFYNSGSTAVLYGGRAPGTSTAMSQQDGNASYATGDSGLIQARIPISGWNG